MSTQQPEALRLADELEAAPAFANSRGTINLEMSSSMAEEAAAELRRLHALNAELLETLCGILKIERGTSGRIIIEGWQEGVIRASITKAEGREA